MNKHHKTLTSRRSVLAGLLSLPAAAYGHEGHAHSRISAEASVVKVENGEVTVRLGMLNTGSTPVSLRAIRAEGAEPLILEEAFIVDGFSEGSLIVRLRFGETVPGVFTAVLDFGKDGKGPVLIMP